jgi:MraZ protein
MPVFSGKFLYKVDVKGRINIPAPYRNQLSERSDNTFHVSYGPNNCLFVYPREIFITLAEQLEIQYGSLSTSDEERRYFLETMINAQPVRCDNQGRIIVPRPYLEYAKIHEEVMIVGAVNKMEFWDPDSLKAFLQNSDFSSQQRVQRFGGADRTFPKLQ